jgi:hypothetical protein
MADSALVTQSSRRPPLARWDWLLDHIDRGETLLTPGDHYPETWSRTNVSARVARWATRRDLKISLRTPWPHRRHPSKWDFLLRYVDADWVVVRRGQEPFSTEREYRAVTAELVNWARSRNLELQVRVVHDPDAPRPRGRKRPDPAGVEIKIASTPPADHELLRDLLAVVDHGYPAGVWVSLESTPDTDREFLAQLRRRLRAGESSSE